SVRALIGIGPWADYEMILSCGGIVLRRRLYDPKAMWRKSARNSAHKPEPDEADDDQINRDDDVEQPGNNQNEDPGNQRHDRRNMGNTECHDFPPDRDRD